MHEGIQSRGVHAKEYWGTRRAFNEWGGKLIVEEAIIKAHHYSHPSEEFRVGSYLLKSSFAYIWT